jgi:hypothetical protein
MHGITDRTAPRGDSVAPARRAGSPSVRAAVALSLATACLILMGTNARPASADIGIPTWAKAGLGAAAAAVSTTIAAPVESAVSVLASVGGGAVANGATAAQAAADLVTAEAIWALPAAEAVGEVAAPVAGAAGLCVGTAGIACAVGTAAALAAGSYAVYKLFGPHTSAVLPNADVVAAGAPTGTCSAGYWTNQQPTVITAASLSCTATAATVTASNASSIEVLQRDTYDDGHVTLLSERCGTGGVTFGVDVTSASAAVRIVKSEFVRGDGTCSNIVRLPEVPLAIIQSGTAPSSSGAPPSRQLVTTRHCISAAGTITTLTATGAAFTEASNVQAVAAIPTCSAGTSVKDTAVISHTLNGTAPDKTVSNYVAPGSVVNGTDPAPVVLYYANPDGTYQTCEQAPSPCANWSTSPTKDDTYQCRQGATVLALSECDVLRARYNGKPQPTDQQPCFDGMGLNPLTWPKGLVISPLKCLFIPDQTAVQGSWSRVGTAWNGTASATAENAVGPIFSAVLDLGTTPPTQGCDGPEFSFPIPGHSGNVVLHPLSTCNQLASYMLGFFMPVASALIYLGAFLGGVRTVAKTIGADGTPG